MVGDGAGAEEGEEGFLGIIGIKRRMSVKTPKAKKLVSIHFFMMVGFFIPINIILSWFCFVKVNTTWV